MILASLTNFKNSIEKSPQLQLDYMICKFLHKTPAEVRELEREGLLTFEQKIFLQATDGIQLVGLLHKPLKPLKQKSKIM